MTRTEKKKVVKKLTKKFDQSSFFYLTDSSELTVQQINQLRGLCYEQDIELKVVKNKLAIKALEALPADRNFADLYSALKGPTAIMFTDTANAPAKVIKEFRKSHEKPVLKAAYIDASIYEGDDQIDSLAALKSKEELIGEIIGLLGSPIQSVLSALDSGGSTVVNLLTALEERPEGWTPTPGAAGDSVADGSSEEQ